MFNAFVSAMKYLKTHWNSTLFSILKWQHIYQPSAIQHWQCRLINIATTV